MVSGSSQKRTHLFLSEDLKLLRFHLRSFYCIDGISTDPAFLNRLLQSAVQSHMDQLDRPGSATLLLHPQVQLAQV
jgi:hypothetical protein